MGFWLSTLSNLVATVGGAFIVGLIGFFLWEPLIKPKALRWVAKASENLLDEQAAVAVAEVQAEAQRTAEKVEQATTPEARTVLADALRSAEVTALLEGVLGARRTSRGPKPMEPVVWHPDLPHIGLFVHPGETAEDARERAHRDYVANHPERAG